jgi:CheY-like chemotaxis protein
MNVLVVEDHKDTLRVLEQVLVTKGFDVTTAQNMETGLGHLRTKRFAAIVSDIVLPDGTGYELISEARRHGIDAVAIAVSGYNYPGEVNEPKLTGFDHHLLKPIDSAQLLALLQTAGVSGTNGGGKI